MNKKGSLLIIFFILVIFIPALKQSRLIYKRDQMVKEVRKYHLKHNNNLFKSIKKFPQLFEGFFRRNFRSKKFFIHLNALFKVQLLHISPNPNIALGENGFYFEGYGARRVEKGVINNFNNIADYMGLIPFSDNELKAWKRRLEERDYWLKQRGIRYIFVLAPTKAFVYPEYLPMRLRKVRGKTRYEQLSEYLKKKSDIPFVDLRPALLKAKNERGYPLLYYKTDFHWNFFGSFVAYQAVINGINQFFPEYGLKPLSIDDFDLHIQKNWVNGRFMDMIGLPLWFHKNEHYITLIPRKDNILSSVNDIPKKGIFDVYPPVRRLTSPRGKKMDVRLILNPKGALSSIMVIGDSFIEKSLYYFSAHSKKTLNFRTIVNFPTRIYGFIKPDIVVQEILNMFILGPPPKNPFKLAESYRRMKFKTSKNTILSIRNKNDFKKINQYHDSSPLSSDSLKIVSTGKNPSIGLPVFNNKTKKTLIMKVSLVTGKDSIFQLWCRKEGTSGFLKLKKRYKKGSEAVYFEIPGEGMSGESMLLLGSDLDKKQQYLIKSIEIRSIDDI